MRYIEEVAEAATCSCQLRLCSEVIPIVDNFLFNRTSCTRCWLRNFLLDNEHNSVLNTMNCTRLVLKCFDIFVFSILRI